MIKVYVQVSDSQCVEVETDARYSPDVLRDMANRALELVMSETESVPDDNLDEYADADADTDAEDA